MPSFLNGSSSLLQVARITIQAWLSSIVGQIPPLPKELAALERLQNAMYNVVGTVASSFLMILHNILDEFECRPDKATENRVSCH